MLDKSVLEFLKDLDKNNTKEWFDINRKRYETVKKSFLTFVENLILEISTFDPDIAYLKPKECIFRINRDIRFSKDKTPYKNNFGAYIVNGGRKSGNAGYYLHLEPNNYFIAGGVYNPYPEALKEIRYEILYNPDKFFEIIKRTDFKNTYGEIWGEKLKKAPKGFDAKYEHIEYLKYKSYVSFRNLKEKEVIADDFMENLKNYFLITSEFNKYLNKIINS